MNRETELQLIQRCFDLSQQRSTTLADSEATSDTLRYRSREIFNREMERLHKKLPTPLVHSSELKEPNSFMSVNSPFGKLIVSRSLDGKSHVFHNTCRHRGAILVSGGKQCAKRITCPYHAWSYTTDGNLASIPGEKHCFPNLDKSQNKLLEIPSVEKYGFIWICPGTDDSEESLDKYLEGISESLHNLDLEHMSVFKRHSQIWNGNWKLFAEGGIETYHFSFAHSNTIGPFFMNNIAAIDAMGNHLRVVMPTKNLVEVVQQPTEQQHLRECSHILYTIFPTSALLIQHKHIDWIYFRPIRPDKTEISITTLVPSKALQSQTEYWQRNHNITKQVLSEDFELGVGIQKSINTGVLEKINYGRNEWALKRTNDLIDCYLRD